MRPLSLEAYRTLIKTVKEYMSIMSPQEIAEQLKSVIKNEIWKDELCVNSRGVLIKYSRTPDEVDRAATVKVGMTVNNEDIAYEAIRIAFEECADEIAEWILTKNAALRLLVEFPDKIGYIKTQDGTVTQSSVAQISIHKAIGDKTKYGFFVSTVLPYIE